MYEGESPYSGTLDKGSFPSVGLYLFDGQWGSGVGEVTMGENALTYNFKGILYQGTFPPVPVTATATVTGSFLPGVLLDHWNILAQDMTVTGLDSTWVRFAPIDGTGGTDNEEGTLVEGIYRPWGISPREAEITARVDAKGDYAFLAYKEHVDEGEERGSGTYHSGKELTMSLMYAPFLVYDERRGTFNGPTDTVYVTVIGGGKSKTIPVILKKTQILLGETKYYYVADDRGKPKVKEAASTSLPNDIIAEFEWGNEPASNVQDRPNSGRRLGVYWEKEKPIPNGTGNLPRGMIRLVGRYWHADSLYKVRLIATTSYDDTASLVIEVKKPARLIDWNAVQGLPDFVNGNDYSSTNDVFGRPLNVDELTIQLAGRTGIPPQIIKGQMYKESDKTGNRFNPTYRYEPFFDYPRQFANLGKKSKDPYMQQPFFVTANGMGDGKSMPTDHSNTRPMTYPRTPTLISRFLLENWNQYTSGRGTERFTLVGSSNYTILWRLLYQDAKRAGWPGNLAIVLATGELRLTLSIYLMNYFAQTRKASS